MNWSLAEVLEAARALPRSERAEIAQELIASLETTDEYDEARYAELRAAVDQGVAGLDAGRSTRLSVEELGGYLSELGRQATERATAKSA
ncbi:hypothetical protein [Gulosibacter sp. 10]|uniref:hypothetical protein n=1 Tax=Gulosibacter sp. 10 TaxID=1255570 RepID=UPI00097EC37D|nr:hypothetical protein [Gulosibacter sp. 10]SJM68976.1 hypothetical protein FM112_13805 [Gulosibacter sp. 10]